MLTRFVWLQNGWSGCCEYDHLIAVFTVFSDRSKVQLIILKNKGMDLHQQRSGSALAGPSHISAFCVVTQRGLLEGYRNFGEISSDSSLEGKNMSNLRRFTSRRR